MVQSPSDDRLSRIQTHWSAVLQAHGSVADAARAARNQQLLRYTGAVYRYLLGAVRDPNTATELCQEFALRFLRGDFHRASPDRGRFRAYIKSALVNLVTDHHRARLAGPRPLAPDVAAPPIPVDDDFAAGWRQDLLDETWKALAVAHPFFHTVLLLRVGEPELSSAEMADRLTRQLGKPVTAENVRKSLQRAHPRFAEMLLEMVADSLDSPSPDELEAELQELDLLRYCRTALDRRRAGGR